MTEERLKEIENKRGVDYGDLAELISEVRRLKVIVDSDQATRDFFDREQENAALRSLLREAAGQIIPRSSSAYFDFIKRIDAALGEE